MRETLSWFETKPLFGWRILVPRTKEQAGSLSARLRGYGGVPEEVPTISVEPPRNPLQMDKAVRGLVEGRYEWIALHLGQRGQGRAREVRGVRPRRPRLLRPQDRRRRRQDRRRRSPTGACAPTWCRRGEQSARGLLEDWPRVRRAARPDQPGVPAARRHRHREPRGRPGRPGLGGRRRHGLPHRAGRAAAGAGPRRDQDRQVRRGRVHVVLDGAQPGRHRRQAAPVDGDRGDRPGHGQDRRGARPAGRRPRARGPTSTSSSTRWPTSARPAARRCSRPASRSPSRPSASRSSRKQGRATPSDASSTARRAIGAAARWSGRGGCARPGGLRRLVAETAVSPAAAGAAAVRARGRRPSRAPISSMPGVVQHTRDSLLKAAARGGRARARRADAVRHPRAQGRRRLGRDRPAGHAQRRDHRRGRRGRRRARP